MKPLPNILRGKRYGSSSKKSGHYKRKQILYSEISNLYTEGNYLVSMPNLISIEVFDLKKHKLLSVLTPNDAGVKKISFTHNYSYLLAFCINNTLVVWNFHEPKAIFHIENIADDNVLFTKDRFFVCVDMNNKAVIADLNTGKINLLSKKAMLLFNLKRKIRLK
jgi:WD40 repeat protein